MASTNKHNDDDEDRAGRRERDRTRLRGGRPPRRARHARGHARGGRVRGRMVDLSAAQRRTKRRQGRGAGRRADLRSASGDAVGETRAGCRRGQGLPACSHCARAPSWTGWPRSASRREVLGRAQGDEPRARRDGRSSSPEHGKTVPDRGGSLNREGLRSGDTVALRTEPEPPDGDRMVARFGQEMTLKRFRRVSEECIEFEPESTNPSTRGSGSVRRPKTSRSSAWWFPPAASTGWSPCGLKGRVLTDGY